MFTISKEHSGVDSAVLDDVRPTLREHVHEGIRNLFEQLIFACRGEQKCLGILADHLQLLCYVCFLIIVQLCL